MNIRTKLTVLFFSMVIIILTLISGSIYYFSENYREEDFYRRLKNRAINTAKVLTEVKEVNAQLLKRMERNNPASLPNQYIAIFDSSNVELYSSDGTSAIIIDTTLLKTISQKKEVHYKFNNSEVLGFSFSDNLNRFTVVAYATDVYGLDALHNLRNVLLIIFCISIVLVSILGWVYAGNVLSPISDIVNEVSKISALNLNKRLDEGNQRDELSKLSQTFNKMLERLQSAFFSQKNFIANASHEIRTPITVMSAEIEVTLIQERSTEHYIKVLRSVLVSLKSLNKLSTQLLLLAQTSADQPEKNFMPIRIDDVLWESKEELTKAYPDCTIDILFDLNLNSEALQIEADEQLLRVAMINLMDNGCKYSDDHHLTVNLYSSETEGIIVKFSNKGNWIEHENSDKIFEPFYRGKSNRKVKGFGIGLSLVSRIIKLHGGEVAVESTPLQTCFTVKFPNRIIKYDLADQKYATLSTN
jgi:signal transduction histidine kinase